MAAGLRGALLRPRRRELSFDYELRRSDRARNIRITVSERGVVVVLPRRAAEREAHAFVAERSDWIERTLARVEAEAEAVAARGLDDGDLVPYLDDSLLLRLLAGDGERVSFARAATKRADAGFMPEIAGELRVRSRDHSRDNVAALLERWYRRRAREEAAARMDAAVTRNGTDYARIAIRDQRTRWGSCSTNGTMSFNWRLMLAPESVFDYVVEHEAAHLEVRDHSPRFWALMDARVPDWRDQRDWLRRHGGVLRLV
ncbi:MAG: M48 family metallopeptidase [Actinobacteria bacterium]|nr:M48 family metallopeptidase [Actinomycetota bacterium]